MFHQGLMTLGPIKIDNIHGSAAAHFGDAFPREFKGEPSPPVPSSPAFHLYTLRVFGAYEYLSRYIYKAYSSLLDPAL